MPAPAWSTLNKALAPTPTFRFTCTLPDVGQVANSPAAAGQQSPGGPEDVALFVERFTPPMGALDVETVPFQSGVRSFPAGASTDSMTVIFIEDTSLSVSQLFINWRALVRDTKGNFGLPSKYKKIIALVPVDLKGGDVATLSWASCWPTHVTLSDFDGSATGYATVTVTFAVDVDDFTINGGTGGGSGSPGAATTDPSGSSLLNGRTDGLSGASLSATN